MLVARVNERVGGNYRIEREHAYDLTPPWAATPYNLISFEHYETPPVAFFPPGLNAVELWGVDVPDRHGAKFYAYLVAVPPLMVDQAALAQAQIAVWNRAGPLPYCNPTPLQTVLRVWGNAGIVAAATQGYAQATVPFNKIFPPRERIRIMLLTPLGFPGWEQPIWARGLGWFWPTRAGTDPIIG
jgi:hypothetical protein